ncbi:hypothetical protein ACWGDE_02790 [Streptomyces sp. NPDC054956]
MRIHVDVQPPTPRLHWPRVETPTHIATTACARPLDDAMRTAFAEMIHWLQAGYGLTSSEAQLLLGPTAEARCTQMVNPHYTCICNEGPCPRPGSSLGAGCADPHVNAPVTSC